MLSKSNHPINTPSTNRTFWNKLTQAVLRRPAKTKTFLLFHELLNKANQIKSWALRISFIRSPASDGRVTGHRAWVVYDVSTSLSRPDRWPCLPVYRFYRLHVCCSPVRWMSLCVAPHAPLLLIPLPLFPPPQSGCQWVSSPPPRLRWSIIIIIMSLMPPETDIVTEFTCHRMHDTSHSIKVDFNGSDLFYSTDNQFTFTVHFTSQIAIVSDMKVQSSASLFFVNRFSFLAVCLLDELYNFSLVILSGVKSQNLKLNKSANYFKHSSECSLRIINQSSGWRSRLRILAQNIKDKTQDSKL